jgi:aconitate hydratase
MAPEYGATMGYFPIDEETCKYLLATGRDESHVQSFRNYFQAQKMFGIPGKGECDYSTVLELNLQDVQPAVAGPKRPQDRINLGDLKSKFQDLLKKPLNENGYNIQGDLSKHVKVTLNGENVAHVGGGGDQVKAVKPKGTSEWTEVEMMNNRPTPDAIPSSSVSGQTKEAQIGHGSVLISAITSCTNTSNPSVMLAAGLLAKKAVEKGLSVPSYVKTSLAPGSRVVTEYLVKTGLQPYLDQLKFQLVGYGCTTCIGNSGPLHPAIEEAIVKNDLVGASVLSGNRNFEARVHQSIKANFLMSPPLVVAFALAGKIDIDLSSEPLGKGKDGKDVYLRDIWPQLDEVTAVLGAAMDPETYRRLYGDFAAQNPMWNQIPSSTGAVYEWDPKSTYIQEPPFFEDFKMQTGRVSDIHKARALAIFGDSVTTDHISPAGAIKKNSPAGKYLLENGVEEKDFNSYGARRGNDRVMTRGTFANVRIKNLMVPGVEGGVTIFHPDGVQMTIYDAAIKYQSAGIPLMIFAGQEYGTGSSRDWAAKGTRLLGVRAVVAESFERIHRSNLVGMGVLPCQFKEGTNARTLNLKGDETFDMVGLEAGLKPQQDVTLQIHRADGTSENVAVRIRIDTPIEIEYYLHGGILPYVLRQLIR